MLKERILKRYRGIRALMHFLCSVRMERRLFFAVIETMVEREIRIYLLRIGWSRLFHERAKEQDHNKLRHCEARSNPPSTKHKVSRKDAKEQSRKIIISYVIARNEAIPI